MKTNKTGPAWTPGASYINKLSSLLVGHPSRDTCGEVKADVLRNSLLKAKESTMAASSTSVDFPPSSLHDEQLHKLIQERRELQSSSLSHSEANARRIALGKKIQKTIKAKRAQAQTDKISMILFERRDLKRLSCLLAPPEVKRYC